MVNEIKIEPLLKKFSDILEEQGYKCVRADYMQQCLSLGFVHAEDFACITIEIPYPDVEDFWNQFGVGEVEVKMRLEKKVGAKLDGDEFGSHIVDESKEYKEVIKDLIKENAITLVEDKPD